MKKLPIKRAHCSYYENVKSKQNRVVTLAQFVTAIHSGHWKQVVEDYRCLKAEGQLKEAERIKGGLPGIVSAGVCEGVPVCTGYFQLPKLNLWYFFAEYRKWTLWLKWKF